MAGVFLMTAPPWKWDKPYRKLLKLAGYSQKAGNYGTTAFKFFHPDQWDVNLSIEYTGPGYRVDIFQFGNRVSPKLIRQYYPIDMSWWDCPLWLAHIQLEDTRDLHPQVGNRLFKYHGSNTGLCISTSYLVDLARFRKVGIREMKLFTFGNPFVSDADRFAWETDYGI